MRKFLMLIPHIANLNSIVCILELKASNRPGIVVDAKWELILRGAAALNDNPFRRFVPMILLRGGWLSFMICDRSGVREWPAIDTRGDGIHFLIKILAWLLFATPENLGFFQGLGAFSEIGNQFSVDVDVLGEDITKKVDVQGAPFVQTITDVIDHRATTVFHALLSQEDEPDQRPLVLKVRFPRLPSASDLTWDLKVAWSHRVRPFEGRFLVALKKVGIKGAPELIAGSSHQGTISHARGFLPDKLISSTSRASKIHSEYKYGTGSGPTSTGVNGSEFKFTTRTAPKRPSRQGQQEGQSKRPKLQGDSQASETKPAPEDGTDQAAGSQATAQAVEGIWEHYASCQRSMALLVTPYSGVSLVEELHPDGTTVTYYEMVLACMRTIDLITTLFVTAMSKDLQDTELFPGMHRDISLNNIVVAKAIPVHGQLQEDDDVVPLIDFEFAAHPQHIEPSGAPHRTGTRLSIAVPLLQVSPPPFHRPFFDFESVFWSLYYRLMSSVIASDPPPDNYSPLVDCVADLGGEDAKGSARTKLEAVSAPFWNVGCMLVRRFEENHKKSGALFVWVLLSRIKRYLFQGGRMSSPDSGGYDEPLDDFQPRIYYRGFQAAHYGSSDPFMGQIVSPWGDDPLVVGRAGQELHDMFVYALIELAKLPNK